MNVSVRSATFALCVILTPVGTTVSIAATTPVGATTTDPTTREVVATIDGETITSADLDRLATFKLIKVKSDEYRIRKAVLDDLVTDRLLHLEAARRGVTVEQLLSDEVDHAVQAATAEELTLIYSATKDKFQALPENVAKEQIAANLRAQRIAKRKSEFVHQLRAKSSVTTLLEPPRVHITEEGASIMGHADAPVTIIEFSDFECPFCSRAAQSLKEVMSKYPDSVRIAFRHFPLSSHTDAEGAARAAVCAEEQGRFWQLHDLLFANAPKLTKPELHDYAVRAGLDAQRFETCFASESARAAVTRDVAAGTKYGVMSTPAIFINGRLVGGAIPTTNMLEIVDEELSRVSSPHETASKGSK